GSPEAEQHAGTYPALADAPVYVRQDVDQAKKDALNSIMGKAWVVVSGIEQIMANPSAAAAMGQGLGVDLSKIPAGVDLYAMLAQMPAAQLEQLSSTIDEKFASLGDSMITQMAAAAVKAEYQAL